MEKITCENMVWDDNKYVFVKIILQFKSPIQDITGLHDNKINVYQFHISKLMCISLILVN